MGVRFVARIAKVKKDKYGIYIPESVFEDEEARELIEKWYNSNQLIIVEIKKLHGVVRQ